MLNGEGADDVKPKPLAAAVFAPGEAAVKDAGQVLRRNAAAVVFDLNYGLPAFAQMCIRDRLRTLAVSPPRFRLSRKN